jgi:hypothetical protein
LGRCAIGKEPQGMHHRIAPLGLIHKTSLQLGKRGGGVHDSPFSLLSGRRGNLPHGTERVTARRRRTRVVKFSRHGRLHSAYMSRQP